jgi:ABC-type dipeptide/oligopeptide/nickel transport system permease component
MLFGVVVAVFLLMNVLPGDPTDVILGREGGGSTQDAREELRRRLGFDRPLHVRFLVNLKQILRGDLGRSILTNQPVAELIGTQLPYTIALAIPSIAVAVLLGVPAGVLAAVKANTPTDLLVTGLTFLILSTPSFVLALLLIMLFSYRLMWFPVVPTGNLAVETVLPTIALGLPAAAAIARVAKSAMLDVLGESYVNTAKSKGLAQVTVIVKHALRNALISITTLVGFYLGYLVTGTVIVETVFARRGIGRVVLKAILERDFATLQAVILLGAVAFILINLFVDLAYAWLDPRISYE